MGLKPLWNRTLINYDFVVFFQEFQSLIKWKVTQYIKMVKVVLFQKNSFLRQVTQSMILWFDRNSWFYCFYTIVQKIITLGLVNVEFLSSISYIFKKYENLNATFYELWPHCARLTIHAATGLPILWSLMQSFWQIQFIFPHKESDSPVYNITTYLYWI